MIKNIVGYILDYYLMYFIDYTTSALLAQTTNTLLIPSIFLNLLLIQIYGFPEEKNEENVMGFL